MRNSQEPYNIPALTLPSCFFLNFDQVDGLSFQDGSCKVSVGSTTLTAHPGEMEMVQPKKSDKIRIMSGALRGSTGKLIGVDGSDGIVRLDDSLDVKILDMVILGKLSVQ